MVVFPLSLQIINLELNTEHMNCSVGILLKYHCYSKMYKCVGPSEVISSKQKKKQMKLDINLLSKTNKYKTKQTNHKIEQANKYQKERKRNLHAYTFYQSDLVLCT